ncbi:hypothetical protein AGMMS49942_12980 [Spirochaetia bacterium]|nr:hypothetical protein AGMMS49942_12980 [Spirochaetia bacterium]
MTKEKALAELDTAVMFQFKAFLDEADAARLSYAITEARRTMLTQVCYFLGGRGMSTADINACRKVAGLYLWTDSENRKITWTLNSIHLRGRAIDIVPLDKNERANYNDVETYRKLAEIAANHGIEWGGNWSSEKRDGPHFQIV